jgi:hypothetical protein
MFLGSLRTVQMRWPTRKWGLFKTDLLMASYTLLTLEITAFGNQRGENQQTPQALFVLVLEKMRRSRTHPAVEL